MKDLLKGRSSTELEEISKMAAQLSEDLKKVEPSYSLAILAGVEDASYNTTANGRISSYHGEAIVEMANGRKWRCIGHKSSGDAYYAYDGFIEFIPIED